jgi:CheY-like chemotaxis protein
MWIRKRRHGRIIQFPTAHAKRVLIAEDDEEFRRMMAVYLRQAGYTVDEAPNGVEALSTMLAVVPDALLLDLQMPQMDGQTLLATCRATPRLASVPVVVLSGMPADEIAANALGARAYLVKPIDLDLLESVLERVTRS